MRTLLDTYNTEHLNYEAYKEWCELNEKEPKGENSEDFYLWIADEVQNEVDDFFTNLEYSKFNLPCIVEGSVGRWNGRFDIEQTYFADLGQERWERNGKVSLNNRENVVTLPKYLW